MLSRFVSSPAYRVIPHFLCFRLFPGHLFAFLAFLFLGSPFVFLSAVRSTSRPALRSRISSRVPGSFYLAGYQRSIVRVWRCGMAERDERRTTMHVGNGERAEVGTWSIVTATLGEEMRERACRVWSCS